jgi:uncharacterized phiE125 gp8 family phage protein
MNKSISLVTAPTVEPVSLPDMKDYLRVQVSEDDNLIAGMIKAARRRVEKYIKKTLITTTFDYNISRSVSVSEVEGGYILLPNPPIQSITSFKYYDSDNTENTYSSDNYWLDVAGDRLVYDVDAIPPVATRNINSYVIRYISGYGDAASDVPEDIIQAVKLYVELEYSKKGGMDENSRFIYGAPNDIQQEAKDILDNYRIIGGGAWR